MFNIVRNAAKIAKNRNLKAKSNQLKLLLKKTQLDRLNKKLLKKQNMNMKKWKIIFALITFNNY